MQFNALETIQAFEAGRGARKERERETAMKGVGNALAGGNYGQAASLGFQIDPMLGMQLTDYGDSRNALNTRKDIGKMWSAGDKTGAMSRAGESGDLEMFKMLEDWNRSATDQQRQDALFANDVMAKTFVGYQGKTPEEIAAAWSVDAPRLQQQFGISPEMMQVDPTNPMQLEDTIRQTQTVAEILSGKRADDEMAYRTKIDARNYNRGVYEFNTTRQDGLDAAEAAAEAEAAAAANPEINVDDEASFRREYNAITGDFRDVQAAYGRIKATDATTPAGQLSLVYQYMKMLDPGSTVMQGEQASAANARGVPEATRNLYNQIILGKPLSTGQVADFVNQADRIYGRSLQEYDQVRTTYEGLAGQYNFDPARVVPDFATGRPEGTVFRGGATTQIPQEAVQLLMSDPSPEALREFDDHFGPGQAQKVLQQRGQFPSRVTF